MPNKINIRQRQVVYRKAIKRFGKVNQMVKAIEEMSELTKVLTKILGLGTTVSREELIEEIADVTIMMEQLRLMYNINDEVCEMMDSKIRRLENRIR